MSAFINKLLSLKDIIWPINGKEHKKFLPLAAMMFFVLFNFATLRSIKDSFVVTTIGAEAISFLKLYAVLPAAMLFVILYSSLCNMFNNKSVFYIISSIFLGYFIAFTFVLYPNLALFHPDPVWIEAMAVEHKNFQWLIRIAGQWSLATFYIMSELWGAMMLSLLFWQFANQITKTEEAKRFYSMFGLLGNLALPMVYLVLDFFLSADNTMFADNIKFTPVLSVIIANNLLLMLVYGWMQAYVLTDKELYNPEEAAPAKKKKTKLSLGASFKLIVTSPYLGLILALVICYGLSINLIEGVWKAKIRELYPTKEGYAMFMGEFQAYQGIGCIIFMIIGNNILRLMGWRFAALLTPLMLLLTGLAFFSCVFFDSTIGFYVSALLGVTPLTMAVLIGMMQNILAKATKYSLFDSTKEMAYIPLDQDFKTKGKAAVDVIGGRFGKSSGAVITSTVFFIMPDMSFTEAMPLFAIVFISATLVWLYAVCRLSVRYNKMVSNQD